MQLGLAWSHAERFLRCIAVTVSSRLLLPCAPVPVCDWNRLVLSVKLNGTYMVRDLPAICPPCSRHARASLSLIRASIHHYKHASSLLRAEGALWLRAYPGREHAAHHYRLASTSLLRYCMAHAHQSFITSSVLVLQASST